MQQFFKPRQKNPTSRAASESPTPPSEDRGGETTALLPKALDAPFTPKPARVADCGWFTPMKDRNHRPIRVLSLDGGGYRGLSSLLALQKVLANARQNPTEPLPHPCEVFDLIVGTSTGGLIALMLGRLGLSIDDAIKLYMEMGPRIFGNKGYGNYVAQGKFDIHELESCMEQVAGKDTLLLQPTDDNAGPSCYTAVTTSFSHLSTPKAVLLRSYLTFDNPIPANHHWTFVEAARATSAAPTYFEPIVVEDILFQDAAASGNNNPADIALKEARNLLKMDEWKGRAGLGPITILSLGTGVASLINKGAPTAQGLASNPGFFSTTKTALTTPGETAKRAIGLAKHFIKIATDSSAVHENVSDQYEDSAIMVLRRGIMYVMVPPIRCKTKAFYISYFSSHHYCRLDVPAELGDIGLADYKRKEAIMTLTDTYLDGNETRIQVKRCANLLKRRATARALSPRSLTSPLPAPHPPKPLSAPQNTTPAALQSAPS
ncbi:hypothetical protein P7C70_g8388, partial [Phenoliferia sp. Uapishka_3]